MRRRAVMGAVSDTIVQVDGVRSWRPVTFHPRLETGALDDETLIKRVVKADKAAFTRLLDRYLGEIAAFARRYVGQHESDDIAQEVFIRVWQKAGQWRAGRGTVRAWLYRIAYNLCMDALKKHRPDAGLDCESVGDEGPVKPDDRAERRDLRRAIDRALADLPERQRSAIALCLIHGLGNREAADTLGISVEALESLLSRGRRQLRQVLRDSLSGDAS